MNDILLKSSQKKGVFYEIYGYPCRHTFKYQDHIAAFVADNLITLEELI